MTDDLYDVRAALGALTTDVAPPPSLVGAGIARGRRLRTRRRVTAVAGVAASVALVAVAGAGVASLTRDDPAVFRTAAGGGRPIAVTARGVGNGTVCLNVSGPGVPPAAQSCWSRGSSYDTAQAVDLGNGEALVIVGTATDKGAVKFSGRGFVETVRMPGVRDRRFAFHVYAGSAAAMPLFTPAQEVDCPDARKVEGAGDPPPSYPRAATPGGALRAMLSGDSPLRSDPRPDGPFLQVTTESDDLVAFVHFDDEGRPDYEVDVVRTADGRWAPRWLGLCTGVPRFGS